MAENNKWVKNHRSHLSHHFTRAELAFIEEHELADLSRLLSRFFSFKSESELSSLLTRPLSTHDTSRVLWETEDGLLVHGGVLDERFDVTHHSHLLQLDILPRRSSWQHISVLISLSLRSTLLESLELTVEEIHVWRGLELFSGGTRSTSKLGVSHEFVGRSLGWLLCCARFLAPAIRLIWHRLSINTNQLIIRWKNWP